MIMAAAPLYLLSSFMTAFSPNHSGKFTTIKLPALLKSMPALYINLFPAS